MLRAWFLLALFALVALSSAFSLEDIHIDGIEEYLHHGEKRQATGTGSITTPPTSRPPPSTPTSEPPSSPTDGPSNPPGSSPPSTPSSPTPAPSSTPSRRTTPTVRTSDLVSTVPSQFTTTVTRTASNGEESVETSTGTTSVPVTSKQVTTDAANTQNGSDSGSGLSQSNKNIIGGVIGGVGGALLLGGIALVFWRMKKRQHKVREDDDDLMAGTGAALGDKSHNHGASPFQSNLEQYHNPGGRPNAAANF